MQIVASEIGATVTGIDAENQRQYLLELLLAAASGMLQTSKFVVGLKASGVPVEDSTPTMLAELLWCAESLIQPAGHPVMNGAIHVLASHAGCATHDRNVCSFCMSFVRVSPRGLHDAACVLFTRWNLSLSGCDAEHMHHVGLSDIPLRSGTAI